MYEVGEEADLAVSGPLGYVLRGAAGIVAYEASWVQVAVTSGPETT